MGSAPPSSRICALSRLNTLALLQIMLVAGDTFRAAAADQLEGWAKRSGASIQRPQSDKQRPDAVMAAALDTARPRNLPLAQRTAVELQQATILLPACAIASVHFAVLVNAQELTQSVTDVTTICQALREGTDVVICDTSGRLHTNYKLMEELAKCHRAIKKKVKGAPHEVLLVLDGTTGPSPTPA